jgi:superfamily II DNA/RNA helicase
VQNPDSNVEARAFYKVHANMKKDPYKVDKDGQLVFPDLHRFCFTTVAFELFCPDTLPAGSMGRRLAMIWQHVMIRRDYTSSCAVDPAGNRNAIGSSMPPTVMRQVQLKYEDKWALMNRRESIVHYGKLYELQARTAPSGQDSVLVNGRASKILTLGATSPLLFFAHFIHDSKVDDPVKLTPKGKPVKIENPAIKALREEHNKCSPEGDAEFLRRLLVDIRDNLVREYTKHNNDHPDDPYAILLPPAILNGGDLRTINSVQLAYTLIQSSPRFRALITLLATQIDERNEKALIFSSSPFEQQLITVVLRTIQIRARSVLATMKPQDKDDVISRFNQPLTRLVDPGNDGTANDDVEVLVLSYWMNSGLNLHSQCHNMHAFSPPPSHPIMIQSCGRIARFGQTHECLVVSYFVAETFNLAMLANLTRNALGGIAATLFEDENELLANIHDLRKHRGEIMHVSQMTPEQLTSKHTRSVNTTDMALYTLNEMLGVTIGVEDLDTSNLTQGEQLFTRVGAVASSSTSKKGAAAAASEPTTPAQRVVATLDAIKDMKRIQASAGAGTSRQTDQEDPSRKHGRDENDEGPTQQPPTKSRKVKLKVNVPSAHPAHPGQQSAGSDGSPNTVVGSPTIGSDGLRRSSRKQQEQSKQ